ncbi:LEA14-like dessication related protein [Alteromonadaceae bacterium Bs31]|nr:LEA14-like dessication related protein [Alteromonadaceae bacterium Bs31]
MARHFLLKTVTCIAFISLCACASMKLEQPQVSIIGFSPVTTQGMEAQFAADIRISNPNSFDLPIEGMSYQLSINGTDLLHGLSNNIPTIPAYGSERVTLDMSVSLLSAPKLFYSLLKNKGEDINYAFTAKIDPKGMLPSFTIKESGVLPNSSSMSQ